MSGTKTVRIMGTSKNLKQIPRPAPGIEIWASNDPAKYKVHARVLKEWTRWFNLHSRRWMEARYPAGIRYYQRQNGKRPIYTQVFWPDIPGCRAFPRARIQDRFAIDGQPNHYFTCTVAWQIALAIHEGFTHIELWGFTLNDHKGKLYVYQRPCFFYWVTEARRRGCEVFYQKKSIDHGSQVPGDPDAYHGPIYGYGTKPEPHLVAQP